MKWMLLGGLVLLTACAPVREPLTRQQWIEMTTHTFHGKTIDQVLEAGEQVLRLSDPGDVSIHHSPNKMVGSRVFTVYAVLAAASGSFNFDLTATQEGEDIKAQLLIGSNSQAMVPTMTYTPGINGGANGVGFTASAMQTDMGRVNNNPEVYDLFFSRMNALLYDGEWLPCQSVVNQAINEFKSVAPWEPLCLNAKDNAPEGIQVKAVELIGERPSYGFN